MIEVTITVKDDSQTLREKFTVHEPIQLSIDDPILKRLIEDTVGKFKGQPEEVIVKAQFET